MYTRIRYGKMICPRCGKPMDVVCDNCGFPIVRRCKLVKKFSYCI